MKSKKDIIDGWISVQKKLDIVSISNFKCPTCKNKTLKYEDIDTSDDERFERNIYCTNCKSVVSSPWFVAHETKK